MHGHTNIKVVNNVCMFCIFDSFQILSEKIYFITVVYGIVYGIFYDLIYLVKLIC